MKHMPGMPIFFAVLILTGSIGPAWGEEISLYPDRALVVYSREHWGCLVEERILEDVAPLITGKESGGVLIEPPETSDDLVVKKELYLYFPAKAINGLPGYFILKLSPGKSPGKGGRPSMTVASASLAADGEGYSIRLKIKSEGSVDTKLFYSRYDKPRETFFACPGPGVSRPGKGLRLRAYGFKVSPKPISLPADGGWIETTLPVTAYFRNEAAVIDRCEQVLDYLDRAFSAPGSASFLWDESRLGPEIIKRSLETAEKAAGGSYDVAITKSEKNRSVEIWSNRTGFVPKLHRRIVVRDKDGKTLAGEVLISFR